MAVEPETVCIPFTVPGIGIVFCRVGVDDASGSLFRRIFRKIEFSGRRNDLLNFLRSRCADVQIVCAVHDPADAESAECLIVLIRQLADRAAQDDVFVRSVCVITGFDVRIAVEIQIAFPADPVRIVVVPVIQIALKIQGYLFQIAGAGAQFCMFPGLVQCRKKHSGKYCNNSNYD